MNTYKRLLPIGTILFFLGCSNSSELIIKSENGRIAERFLSSHDSNHSIKYLSYHLNGSIKEEGFILSGERTGEWKQYYSDGIVRWIGEYRNGERENPPIDSTIKERTTIVFKGILNDKYYAFRFVMPDYISPDELIYSNTNSEIKKIKNFDSCDFLLKPLKSDTINLQIHVIAKNGVFEIFKKDITPSMLKNLKTEND